MSAVAYIGELQLCKAPGCLAEKGKINPDCERCRDRDGFATGTDPDSFACWCGDMDDADAPLTRDNDLDGEDE